MAQRQTQNQKPKEKTYTIVDIMDVDTSKFTFGNPKPNPHGGKFIPVKYDGKVLYIKTPLRKVLFGASPDSEKEKGETKDWKYPEGKKKTGYTAAFSFGKDYEEDSLFLKFKALDEFFIDMCVQYGYQWGLGGSLTKPLPREAVAGYDDKGDKGKWKWLIKYPYSVDKITQQKTYKDYPPNFQINIPCQFSEEQGDDGKTVQRAIFKPSFYDADGNRKDGVTSDEIDEIFPAWANVSGLSMWNRISIGTYGASLRAKAQQFRVFPNETLPQDECYLDDDEESDEGDLVPEMVLDSEPRRAKAQPAAVTEEVEELVDDGEPLEVVQPVVVPKPAPTRATRTLTINKK